MQENKEYNNEIGAADGRWRRTSVLDFAWASRGQAMDGCGKGYTFLCAVLLAVKKQLAIFGPNTASSILV